MTRIYVVDTSYLLELFNVPGFANVAAVAEIRAKFEAAINQNSQIIVPLGCIFELADHIADVPDVARRRQLAEELARSIAASLQTSQPWQITPPDKLSETLPGIFASYAEEYLAQGMGLTDTYTLTEATRLKKKYASFADYKVHIWTKDAALKAHEPDEEDEPYT